MIARIAMDGTGAQRGQGVDLEVWEESRWQRRQQSGGGSGGSRSSASATVGGVVGPRSRLSCLLLLLVLWWGTLGGIVGRRMRGEASEDALKDAENELGRGGSGEEAWGDKKEVVAIVGWVGGRE